jgi:membrane protease YdiL (CAAX protease family)
LGLAFSVLNSVKEEVLYRGLLFSRTLQFGFGISLVCQFLWFSLIHILYSQAGGKSVGMFFGVGVFAMLAAWTTKKFDSLICPVLVHTGIDMIIFMATIPNNYSA